MKLHRDNSAVLNLLASLGILNPSDEQRQMVMESRREARQRGADSVISLLAVGAPTPELQAALVQASKDFGSGSFALDQEKP